jgi:nucleoside-diphosphate-sugar epimerase
MSTNLSVFLTGGNTGLGREVTRQLVTRGHRVTATVNDLESAAALRAAGGLPVYNDLFRAGEIASVLKMAEANVVVNLAPQAVNGLPFSTTDWDYYTRLLGEGAAALAAGAAQAGVSFIVHTSFTFLYGHAANADETAALVADNPLFAAAAAGEKAVLNGTVPGCVLRTGFTYGSGSASIFTLRDTLRAGRSLMLGDEHHTVSWTHESDLAQAVVLAVEQQPAGEIFNIVDDNPASTSAFVDHFAESFGVVRPGRQNLPPFLANAILNKIFQAMLGVSASAKNDKAKAQLGWAPRYPHHKQGIEQTLLAWRAEEAANTIVPNTTANELAVRS